MRRPKPSAQNEPIDRMKLVFTIAVLVWLQGCVAGPSLGPAQKVAIAGTGGERPNDPECRGFKLSLHEAQRFLNRAKIITPYELHDSYDWLPCYVTGTAEFRGLPATWLIRLGGTGSITILGEFTYSIADEKQQDDLQ
jgi:hypothetical protein